MHEELKAFIDEVRLSFHTYSEFARRAHRDHIDPPGRAVLEYLANHQPSTVPAIARSRGVSRQHIQTIANALASSGLVTLQPNPAHKRSPLLALTKAGRDMIKLIAEREQSLTEPLVETLDRESLIAATNTLRHARTLIADLETP